jgi:hypothetical protein
VGHEERFLPSRLSAGFLLRKETIAGRRRNGREALSTVIPVNAVAVTHKRKTKGRLPNRHVGNLKGARRPAQEGKRRLWMFQGGVGCSVGNFFGQV